MLLLFHFYCLRPPTELHVLPMDNILLHHWFSSPMLTAWVQTPTERVKWAIRAWPPGETVSSSDEEQKHKRWNGLERVLRGLRIILRWRKEGGAHALAEADMLGEPVSFLEAVLGGVHWQKLADTSSWLRERVVVAQSVVGLLNPPPDPEREKAVKKTLYYCFYYD